MADRGHCLCGAIRREITGPRLWSGYCRCESCRRNCAAPVTAYFGVRNGDWRWSGQVPATYASAPGVTRHFCGTPVAYASTIRPITGPGFMSTTPNICPG
ncbi:GFA family protein [Tropicimonas aquimaris]|uniref:GFA family protein n=1 Tax=Tropicimonas aquimaris TaxID=914152 RepID=A0ABW3IJQ8_9RHOB